MPTLDESAVGTHNYLQLEALQLKQYSGKTDVFAKLVYTSSNACLKCLVLNPVTIYAGSEFDLISTQFIIQR